MPARAGAAAAGRLGVGARPARATRGVEADRQEAVALVVVDGLIEYARGHQPRVEERASFRSTLLAQLILNLVTVEAILLEGLFQEMGDLF